MTFPVSIGHQQAFELILKQLRSVSLQTETCAVTSASGRYLAEDIHAPINVPQNDCSRMDGYAINSARVLTTTNVFVLEVGEAIHTAAQEHVGLCGDTAIPVMTGALIPEDADAIILKEQVSIRHNQIHFKELPKKGEYIRLAGTDLKQGQVVMKTGQQVTAACIGLLSSLGISFVQVKKRPSVALMMTGDELIQAGECTLPGQIYDSNSPMLSALLSEMGCEIELLEPLNDAKQAVFNRIKSSHKLSCDLIISVGGVSMGDKDWIPLALEEYGEVVFHKLQIKPGFPMLFGKLGSSLFFGLPGNPVSAYTTLCQYVYPVIQAIQTISPVISEPITWSAILNHDLLKNHNRREFVRAKFTINKSNDFQLVVNVCGDQQSSRIESLAAANCFVVLPEDPHNYKPGDVVKIQPFNQFKV